MVKEEELQIAAHDGYPLAATRRRLDAVEEHAILLIAAAAAVPAGFFRRLAERGFDTVTFDYRCVGGSRPESLKGFDAQMRDWAERDTVAAVDYAAALHLQKPLVYVGHSFGGQALGLLPNNDKVRRALLVASQAGYWAYLAGFEKYRAYALLRFVAPALVRVYGYLRPGVGLGDGPAGARTPAICSTTRRSPRARTIRITEARCGRSGLPTIPGRRRARSRDCCKATRAPGPSI